jgi:hypothetical protein
VIRPKRIDENHDAAGRFLGCRPCAFDGKPAFGLPVRFADVNAPPPKD